MHVLEHLIPVILAFERIKQTAKVKLMSWGETLRIIPQNALLRMCVYACTCMHGYLEKNILFGSMLIPV